jgi:hypothetical protein
MIPSPATLAVSPPPDLRLQLCRLFARRHSRKPCEAHGARSLRNAATPAAICWKWPRAYHSHTAASMPSLSAGTRNPTAAYGAGSTNGKTYVASPVPHGTIEGPGQPGAGYYIRIIKRMPVLTSELLPSAWPIFLPIDAVAAVKSARLIDPSTLTSPNRRLETL